MAKRRKLSDKELRHRLDRIIVGNQIIIMGSLMMMTDKMVLFQALKVRVHNQKQWWRDTFGEEVGFESALGDEPPGRG